MIIKELDAFADLSDARATAGRAAEEQMAFYQRRAFQDQPDIYVVNGLRLVHRGEVAQIDHLVLHAHGLVLVESKSVTIRVQINAHGEWVRWYKGSRRGMPSPILQAQRQADILGDLLLAQPALACATLIADVVIAISDSGVIDRPSSLALDEVCKADQVPALITQLIAQRQQAPGPQRRGLLPWRPRTGEQARGKSAAEIDQIATCLLQHHHPLQPTIAQHDVTARATPATSRPSSPEDQTERRYACRQCGGDHLAVMFGHSYYFRCLRCKANTPIAEQCTGCGTKLRVRKSGAQFFMECAACATSRLFYINTARVG